MARHKGEILKEYFTIQQELEDKYGPRSLVLMQVGKFYEIYGVELPHANPPIRIGHAEAASLALQMQIGYKKGRDVPHGLNNPMMVGFPDYVLGNHLSKLLKANFVVAVYDQYDIPKQKEKGHKLVHTYSPSTYIDEDVDDSNCLMAVFLDKFKCPITNQELSHVHIAILELITGTVYLCEVYDTKHDIYRVSSELYRIIHTYNPSEIIYCSTENENFINNFDLHDKKVYFKPLNAVYNKVSYQNEFLQRVYKIGVEHPKVKTELTPLEYLNLNKTPDLVPCFIQALQYAYEHDPLIVTKIKIPIFIENSSRLILNNDSLYQLNLVSGHMDSRFNSLFDVVNKTRTPMGKRLLRERLLAPILDPMELENRYQLIAKMLKRYPKYDDRLKGIDDLERGYRKLVTGKLQPYEFARFADSFTVVQGLLSKARELFKVDQNLLNTLNEFMSEYSDTFDQRLLAKSKLVDVKRSYFLEGVRTEIDELENSITCAHRVLSDIAEEISQIIDKDKIDLVKIESTEKEGFHLAMTKKRWKLVPCELELEYTFNNQKHTLSYNDLEITTLKSGVKISSRQIRTVSRYILNQRSKLGQFVTNAYQETLKLFDDRYGKSWLKAAESVAEIDFIYSAAKVAALYGYVKPEIDDEQRGKSFVVVTDLRHPIVERIREDLEYIPNDLELGVDKHKGTLIYGLNLSGKSVLLKSLGCAIVMAQAGMYVAASSFLFYPYTQILSKISVNDNIFKGQSTFMVEVSEVRDMLNRADPRTLVLSDELCSSTESLSAHAIVASTMSMLVEKGANFLFSTHLHELQNISLIRDNQSIKIMHFKVHIKDKQLVFDRKLQNGGLNELYGLEIAGVLGLGTEFMERAVRVRNGLKKTKSEILSTKGSNYNRDVWVHECCECGTQEALEAHHIRHQACADENGLIDKRFHKNKRFNLMVVCKKCHTKIHHS